MIFVTEFNNKERYYYFETKEQKSRALLAILTKAHKEFFAKDELTVDMNQIRYRFVKEDWEMATLDDAVVATLPETMQKKVLANKNRYNFAFEAENRRVSAIFALRNMMAMPVEEAIALTVKDNNGKNAPAIQVIADELNEIVKERTNDGYRNGQIFEIRKTEKY